MPAKLLSLQSSGVNNYPAIRGGEVDTNGMSERDRFACGVCALEYTLLRPTAMIAQTGGALGDGVCRARLYIR